MKGNSDASLVDKLMEEKDERIRQLEGDVEIQRANVTSGEQQVMEMQRRLAEMEALGEAAEGRLDFRVSGIAVSLQRSRVQQIAIKLAEKSVNEAVTRCCIYVLKGSILYG